MKNILLKNGETVQVRCLQKDDAALLIKYLDTLSAESKSRFGPHPFDRHTVEHICHRIDDDDVMRYVALHNGNIVSYMLVKHGLIEWDSIRLAEKQQYFDFNCTATFAPSVLDAWQNTGLGTAMIEVILHDLRRKKYKQVLLWGGVQAGNARAVHFYKKHGFKHIGSFWHDGKDNHDMILDL